MAFAGQAPTIIVLKEGPYRLRLRRAFLEHFFADVFILLMDRDGYISGKGTDCFEHQRLCCGAVDD